MTRIALLTVGMLQLADLASTWLGMRQGFAEADGTSLAHLALMKLAMLALLWLLLRGRRPAAWWTACGIFAAVMLPIVAHNFSLILHGAGR